MAACVLFLTLVALLTSATNVHGQYVSCLQFPEQPMRFAVSQISGAQFQPQCLNFTFLPDCRNTTSIQLQGSAISDNAYNGQVAFDLYESLGDVIQYQKSSPLTYCLKFEAFRILKGAKNWILSLKCVSGGCYRGGGNDDYDVQLSVTNYTSWLNVVVGRFPIVTVDYPPNEVIDCVEAAKAELPTYFVLAMQASFPSSAVNSAIAVTDSVVNSILLRSNVTLNGVTDFGTGKFNLTFTLNFTRAVISNVKGSPNRRDVKFNLNHRLLCNKVYSLLKDYTDQPDAFEPFSSNTALYTYTLSWGYVYVQPLDKFFYANMTVLGGLSILPDSEAVMNVLAEASKLSMNAIVGIVVASVLVFGLIIFGFSWCTKTRRKRRARRSAGSGQAQGAAVSHRPKSKKKSNNSESDSQEMDAISSASIASARDDGMGTVEHQDDEL